MLTYGDGVADVNVSELERFHRSHGKIATMTAIRPEGRFGMLDVDKGQINSFREKSQSDAGFINGGFMVLQPEIMDYLNGDDSIFEQEPLEALAASGQLMAYIHDGFWQCMDTQRDKKGLEELWHGGNAPWKVWKDHE